MPSLDDLGIVHPALFCAAVLLLNLTPGPDTAFIVSRSVAHGRRAGALAVLGISAGCLVHTLALALGLSAIVAASAGAFAAIKVAGAIYLGWLGTRMIVASFSRRAATSAAPSAPAAAVASHRLFVQGLLTNLLNPKVVLFFLSFFPQFVAATSPSKAGAFLALGVALTAISTVYNGAVAWLAGGIATRMRGAPRVRAWLDRSIGAAFIGLGVRIAFTER